MNKIVAKSISKKMLERLLSQHSPGNEKPTEKTLVRFHLSDNGTYISIDGGELQKWNDEEDTGEFLSKNMGIDNFEKIVGYINMKGLYAEIHHEVEGEKVKTIFKL